MLDEGSPQRLFADPEAAILARLPCNKLLKLCIVHLEVLGDNKSPDLLAFFCLVVLGPPDICHDGICRTKSPKENKM